MLGCMPSKETNHQSEPSGLGFAVWSEDESRIRLLLDAGTSPDDFGDGILDKTPLMESVDEHEDFYDQGREAVTKLLLQHGADVHRTDSEGRTALHYAVVAGARAVTALLEAGADPNAAASDGSTPLHEAALRLDAGSAAALCQFGADASTNDAQGRTPAALAGSEAGSDADRDAFIAAIS